ncbi:DUF6510 family protein [Streptomyces seoulensis]|uniref:DUF6510 family protein n=1 Tax=Streptomyces seoulensis TaxID=73044 RepID=UPI0033BD52A8
MEDRLRTPPHVVGRLFAVDLTLATCRCAHCGAEGSVSTLQLYNRAPGLVARCPFCEGVVLRFVLTNSAAYLDLRGSVMLEVPLPETD